MKQHAVKNFVSMNDPVSTEFNSQWFNKSSLSGEQLQP